MDEAAHLRPARFSAWQPASYDFRRGFG